MSGARRRRCGDSHFCRFAGQINSPRCDTIKQQIKYLTRLAQRCEQLRPSTMEFAYLKTIAFTADDLPPAADTLLLNATGSGSGQAVGAFARRLNAHACVELYDWCLRAATASGGVLTDDAASEHESSVTTATMTAMAVGGGGSGGGGAEAASLSPTNSSASSVQTSGERRSTAPNRTTRTRISGVSALLQAASSAPTDARGVNGVSAAVYAALQRYSQLLQLLALLRWFQPEIIVEVFFRLAIEAAAAAAAAQDARLAI